MITRVWGDWVAKKFLLKALNEEKNLKFLGPPIDPVARGHDIALQIIENIFPFPQNPLSIFVGRVMVNLGSGLQIDSLHFNRGNLATILQLDDPIAILVAADRFVGVDRLSDFELRRFSAFDQAKHERSRPDF